jgi:hypothetical protein
MKTFFVILAAFSLALIIGCQENMLNEPSDALLKHSDNLVTTSNIKLNYDLRDPLAGTSKLSGQVSYTFQVITEAMNPMALNRVAIHIDMDAELDDMYGMMHLQWLIQGRSDDVVTVSEEGIVLIDKCYSITNRNDVVLLVQYLVTTNGIGISNVSLAPLEK